MVDRVGDWRRGVRDSVAFILDVARAMDGMGATERARALRAVALDIEEEMQPPADLRDHDDERWKPENFAPLVDGVAYRC